MARHPIYDRLLEGITEMMERRVLEALLDRAGEPVTRLELIEVVHGLEARKWAEQHGLANSTADRQNRQIIETLQAKDYPIVASSGAAGYVLASDDDMIDEYLTELASRQQNLAEKISHVRKARKWAPFIREWKSGRAVVQPKLL